MKKTREWERGGREGKSKRERGWGWEREGEGKKREIEGESVCVWVREKEREREREGEGEREGAVRRWVNANGVTRKEIFVLSNLACLTHRLVAKFGIISTEKRRRFKIKIKNENKIA